MLESLLSQNKGAKNMKRALGSWHFVAILSLIQAGCSNGMANNQKTSASADEKEITTKSGLKYVDLEVGTGAEATSGHLVEIFYTGWLASNGKKFDSNVGTNRPLVFRLGKNPPEVIKGFEEGVMGMKEGGKRKLLIPPELGYGSRGAGSAIPPNSDLIFEVELRKVR
jgi:FKBP-type peptidyl-prolyl cis-trans isomerase